MKSDLELLKIYTIHVEEEHDYYFEPIGVMFLAQEHRVLLYCSDVRYNELRAVYQKFPVVELEKGVQFKSRHYIFKDITEDTLSRYGKNVNATPLILQDMYESRPKQFHFLKRIIEQEQM